MHENHEAAEVGRAATAVLVALMQTLVDKGILSDADLRRMLTGAATRLGPLDYGAPASGATGIILNEVLPQFPDSGGD